MSKLDFVIMMFIDLCLVFFGGCLICLVTPFHWYETGFAGVGVYMFYKGISGWRVSK